ncbi:DUF2336 domain-containing protein [Methylobacterium marchantiae]|uniref:DUF2336 domain-containing protein n=1 Tax=Methylobacterium marchantiae TaxID=600331 RepID=A0ABW3X117_9HYPH|nr:hypothetical protein AIGOOFII_2389 [Methylobacterium marchantiae]
MIESLLADVERAATSGGAQSRRAILRRVTHLFTAQASVLGEAQVQAFDDVILVLARPAESASRAALSNILADIPNAPAKVVRDLAYDAAASVACPVLARSARIVEDDLVTIAGMRGQEHLGALARRSVLNERVTDVLVQRGGPAVRRTVVANNRAKLSETTFGTLADLAAADADLLEMLEERADKPNHLRHLRRATADPGGGRPKSPGMPVPASAQGYTVADIEQQEKVVVALLARGNIQQAALITARIADIPTEMALGAFRSSDHAPLLLLFRTVGFGWTSLRLFIEAKPEVDMTPEEWRGVFETYHALTAREARRTVRLVARRFRV